MKIAVIGYSGAGKSTFSAQMGDKYGCPVLYLDTVNFLPGWEERDGDEGRKLVREFMKTNSSWVIDGNYERFYQKRRLAAADRIYFFDFPRYVCFYQAFRRFLTSRNKCRDSMAEGCEEKLDLEFMKWILWDGRTRKRRRHYEAICKKYKQKTVRLKNRRQVEQALREA